MSDLTSIPQYRVSIWEGIGIAAGAVVLVAIGVAGLSVKALNNAFEPQRAEAVAQSLVDYAIPGGSKGLFSTNIGGGKVAVISSTASLSASDDNSVTLPLVEFTIAQIPVQPTANVEGSASEEIGGSSDFLFSGFSFSNQTADAFQVATRRTEERAFCGAIAPVTIEEGNLTLIAQAPPVPAVRYQTQVILNKDEHIAVVSAVGQNARENAATVFESLKCQQ